MEKVNVEETFARISEYWRPHRAAELNGQYVKLVKFLGPFVWHHHENEDELILVIKGRMLMEFRDRTVAVDEGEFIVVPRGVDHRSVAEQEVHAILLGAGIDSQYRERAERRYAQGAAASLTVAGTAHVGLVAWNPRKGRGP